MNRLLRRIAQIFFGRVMPRWPYRVIKGPLRGKKFILGTLGGPGGGSTVYFNMLEQEQTNTFLEIVKLGDVLFDIGANVGYYTVLGSTLVGTTGLVVAVEPVIRNVTFLYKHVKLNKLNNVRIISAACSNHQKISAFDFGPNNAMGHIVVGDELNDNVTYVPVITLDEISKSLNSIPSVIKIDVEGAECEVLEGALNILKTSKPKVFLSIHSDYLRNQCLLMLKNLNYDVQPLNGSVENATEYLFCNYNG